MAAIQDMKQGDYVKFGDRLHRIKTIWGVDPNGRVAPPSKGGFGVVTDEGIEIDMWHAQSYHKRAEIEPGFDEEKYKQDHPDLDYEKLREACRYALLQFEVADEKESDAPCSAEEHRSMAFRKLRDAMISGK